VTAARHEFISSLRALINTTVASDALSGDEALGALMYLIAAIIGRVKDPTDRLQYVNTILETLPAAVEFEAGNTDALRIHESDREKMQ
jgi:hypothetical protein